MGGAGGGLRHPRQGDRAGVRGKEVRVHNGAPVASAAEPSRQREARRKHSAFDWTASARRLVSLSFGGNLRNTGRLRLRKDVHQLGAVEALEFLSDCLRRLRRTGQRNGRSALGFSGADHQSEGEGGNHHAEDLSGGQHFQHARRSQRGLHLHWDHALRVLPRHGLPRKHDGRQHLALGRGAEGNIRATGANARRLGVPGVPAFQAGAVLRTRGESALLRKSGSRGLDHNSGRSVPAWRRFYRPSDSEHVGHCPSLLGTRQKARTKEALPRH